jgi:hypothetical protein
MIQATLKISCDICGHVSETRLTVDDNFEVYPPTEDFWEMMRLRWQLNINRNAKLQEQFGLYDICFECLKTLFKH